MDPNNPLTEDRVVPDSRLPDYRQALAVIDTSRRSELADAGVSIIRVDLVKNVSIYQFNSVNPAVPLYGLITARSDIRAGVEHRRLAGSIHTGALAGDPFHVLRGFHAVLMDFRPDENTFCSYEQKPIPKLEQLVATGKLTHAPGAKEGAVLYVVHGVSPVSGGTQ